MIIWTTYQILFFLAGAEETASLQSLVTSLHSSEEHSQQEEDQSTIDDTLTQPHEPSALEMPESSRTSPGASPTSPEAENVSPSAPPEEPTSPEVPLQPHGGVLDAPPSYDDVIRGKTQLESPSNLYTYIIRKHKIK